MEQPESNEAAERASGSLERMVRRAIIVWPFDEAPEEYSNLSPHGGDEDWVAFVPEYLKGGYIGWLESGSSFGCCDVSEHIVEGGIVRIGAHA